MRDAERAKARLEQLIGFLRCTGILSLCLVLVDVMLGGIGSISVSVVGMELIKTAFARASSSRFVRVYVIVGAVCVVLPFRVML